MTAAQDALAEAMTEAQLLTGVSALARDLGWLCYHTHDSRRSEPGFPDLVLVQGDRCLFRELKTSSGRVTAAQRKWLHALAATGADASVWRPWDLLDGTVLAGLRGAR